MECRFLTVSRFTAGDAPPRDRFITPCRSVGSVPGMRHLSEDPNSEDFSRKRPALASPCAVAAWGQRKGNFDGVYLQLAARSSEVDSALHRPLATRAPREPRVPLMRVA